MNHSKIYGQENLHQKKSEGLLERLAFLEKRLENLEKQMIFFDKHSAKLDMKTIASIVAQYYQIPLSLLLSNDRALEYVRPRQVAIYLCRYLLRNSYTTIALFFKRDKTAISHSVKIIEIARKEDPEVNHIIKVLEKKLKKYKESLVK